VKYIDNNMTGFTRILFLPTEMLLLSKLNEWNDAAIFRKKPSQAIKLI